MDEGKRKHQDWEYGKGKNVEQYTRKKQLGGTKKMGRQGVEEMEQ